jgi:hypothetical protein
MAIQDTDPERRNLTVTSVAFIAYYYAGGEVLSNEVRIQVVNVAFSNPMVLAVMAWILLLWFALRYWQTRNSRFVDEFVGEVQPWKTRPYVLRYAERKLKSKTNVDGGFHISGIVKAAEQGWGLNYDYIKSPTFNKVNGSIDSYSVTERGFLKLSAYVWARIFTSCALAKKSFSGYVVPYILFCIACLGPAYKYGF